MILYQRNLTIKCHILKNALKDIYYPLDNKFGNRQTFGKIWIGTVKLYYFHVIFPEFDHCAVVKQEHACL